MIIRILLISFVTAFLSSNEDLIPAKIGEKEILLKSELEELSKNLEQRSALLDKEKKRLENLASKKQNKINERRIEELVSQLGRLEDEIEEKDKALLKKDYLKNKETEKLRNNPTV